jgi:hypothetical protein
MPDLLASLLPHDLGHLRILAEFWGLTLHAQDRDSAAEELSDSLLDPKLARETIEILPVEGRAALDALLAAGGRFPWVEFARQFGEIRQIGAGRRDRELPYRNPVSTAEILYYRGLLGKAFFDTEKGAQEFAYIPDDLLEIIRKEGTETGQPALGRPATPVEKAHEIPASDRVLDEATSLLAALRMDKAGFQPSPQLSALLQTAKLLKKNVPQAEAVKAFLEAERAHALSLLIKAWKTSTTFNELRLLPSILCEGEWKNSPLETRQTLLNFIKAIPLNQWWSLPAFLRDLKLKHPDFQRPAGDYDSWFIKRTTDGQYLRGFAYWDAVDGTLVRSFIQTLHWLGLADLAAPQEGMDCSAFRITLNVQRSKVDEKGKISISSNGKIFVSRMAPRAIRYQISRFCEWDEEKPDGYPYRVSARSLKHAAEQGLKAEQLLTLLVKHTHGSVPPALVKALKRWEIYGTEARAEKLSVLKVSRPEVLEELRASKAGRFLGEPLGPTAVIIKEETIQKVAAALAELGLLLDVIEPPGL